jgi:hypothetical protein
MAPSVSAFRAPKAGSTAEEWEDAFCFDPGQGRFCVADGASESSFSAAWARLLAEGFVARPPDGSTLRDWLRPLQVEWARGTKGRALPWYAEEKARSGAFSSILGFCLEPDEGVWRALAVGDSCLFSVRENHLAASFPLSRSSEFHSRPMLLSSADRANAGIASAVRETEGLARPGDLMLLMTDALAAWFLAEAELRRRPWALLERIATQEEFETFVDLMRAGRSMRNDDVTLLKIEVTP